MYTRLMRLRECADVARDLHRKFGESDLDVLAHNIENMTRHIEQMSLPIELNPIQLAWQLHSGEERRPWHGYDNQRIERDWLEFRAGWMAAVEHINKSESL